MVVAGKYVRLFGTQIWLHLVVLESFMEVFMNDPSIRKFQE